MHFVSYWYRILPVHNPLKVHIFLNPVENIQVSSNDKRKTSQVCNLSLKANIRSKACFVCPPPASKNLLKQCKSIHHGSVKTQRIHKLSSWFIWQTWCPITVKLCMIFIVVPTYPTYINTQRLGIRNWYIYIWIVVSLLSIDGAYKEDVNCYFSISSIFCNTCSL